MPERATVPGRIVVGAITIVALVGLLWLLQDGFGTIADGSVNLQLMLSPGFAQHVDEIRFNRHPTDVALSPNQFDEAEKLDAPNMYRSRIPTSSVTHGIIFKRRVVTVPIPSKITLWFRFLDGSWHAKVVDMPKPAPAGTRLVTVNEL